jgi:hypothetical protein
VNTQRRGICCTRLTNCRKRKRTHVGWDADVEGAALYRELHCICRSVKKLQNPTPLNSLNFLKKFNVDGLATLISVCLRIF